MTQASHFTVIYSVYECITKKLDFLVKLSAFYKLTSACLNLFRLC